MTLNAQQRTTLRQSIIASPNVPRFTRVNFALIVGTFVPATVRLVPVLPVLVDIRPEFRDDSFFVVNDDVFVVDRSRRIVATVPLGESGPQFGSAGGARFGASAAGAGLSSEEIRQVQIALSQQGFDIGTPDGVLGPRTTQALISFQQQQGLQATGRIDEQTFAALGLNQGGAQQGSQQPSTTGQGGNMMQQPPAAQSQQPATTGQGGNTMQQPSAGQSQQPATTGQGGNTMQQPPAAQPQQPSTTGQGFAPGGQPQAR